MATAPQTIKPPLTKVGPIGWIKSNLMSTWYNALLTVLLIVLIYFLLKGFLTWAFGSADWSPIISNPKLFLVGQYPSDQMWRVGISGIGVSFLVGLTWGVWGGIARNFALILAIAVGAPALLPLSLEILGLEMRLWLLATPALIAVGYLVASTPVAQPRRVIIGWLLSFFLTLILLRGFQGNSWLPLVEPVVWGGLMLTFLLALVGIVASFPLGVLLALGRRSTLPMVKIFSIMFIELVRGVPLVTLLFMTQIILPLFLPEGIRVDRVLRALVAITLFSAAYMAENVRGGLQSVPKEQTEAAEALGLPGRQVMLFIILPQALRAAIPTIVGQFISLFKDTSLVVTVGLLDIVGIGKSIVLGNVQWIGAQREVYVFLACVFWVFTYSMSYVSHKLEAVLGVGKR